MNTLSGFSSDIPRQTPISDDFSFACLWASLGLVPLVDLTRQDTDDTDQHHGEGQSSHKARG
ncbi:MAG: hypothetical protein ACLPKB_11825 [Xanthobacteraceae bacterium]